MPEPKTSVPPGIGVSGEKDGCDAPAEGARAMSDWREVPTHPGLQVTSDGQVRSLRGPLKAHRDPDGYLRVSYSPGGRRTSAMVHRLVAAAFLGPIPPGHEVAHKDHDRANPRVENLEYLTHADNVRASAAAGRAMRGESHVSAVITEAQAREMLAANGAGVRPATLARKYGLERNVVYRLVRGETWKHLHGEQMDV